MTLDPSSRHRAAAPLQPATSFSRPDRWLSFRVRRRYFDAIVMGTKTDEIRKRGKFWDVRIRNIADAEGMPYPSGIVFRSVGGVFLCGKDRVRFKLRGVELHPSAESALRREPSDQGRLDLGTGEVWRFLIGDRL